MHVPLCAGVGLGREQIAVVLLAAASHCALVSDAAIEIESLNPGYAPGTLTCEADTDSIISNTEGGDTMFGALFESEAGNAPANGAVVLQGGRPRFHAALCLIRISRQMTSCTSADCHDDVA